MPLPRSILLVSFAVLLGGCSVDTLELAGRECPCIDGWVCDDARNVCVEVARDGGGDAFVPPDADAAADSGADTALPDTGIVDMDAFVDSAMGDTAVADTSAPPPGSNCGTVFADALFCDGFESGGLAGWTQRTPDGSSVSVIGVTDGPVYRGEHALRATALMGSVEASIYRSVYTTPSTEQWLRFYYYVPSATMRGMEILGIGNSPEANAYIDDQIGQVHAHDFAADTSAQDRRVFPQDTWVCVEFHLGVDATAGVIELFWDGALVVSTTEDTTHTSRLEDIGIGIPYKDRPDPDAIVYVDEVVADDARVGCD